MLANTFLTLLYVYLAGFGVLVSLMMLNHSNRDLFNLWMALTAILYFALGAIAIGGVWL